MSAPLRANSKNLKFPSGIAAAEAGGGTVDFPAGTWVTGSLRLRSNVTLRLEPGSVIEASTEAGEYDAAEPNEWDRFQDVEAQPLISG